VDQGGKSVTGYRIYIETSSSTFEQETTNCDGVNNSSVVSSRTCTISANVLRASPFSLTTGTSVKAKLIAFNIIGDSAESAIGSGAVMPIPPTVASAPLVLARNEAITSQTQVAFTWQPPSSNGYRTILDYTIQWNQGSGSTFVVLT